jgi:hypothetical protein
MSWQRWDLRWLGAISARRSSVLGGQSSSW